MEWQEPSRFEPQLGGHELLLERRECVAPAGGWPAVLRRDAGRQLRIRPVRFDQRRTWSRAHVNFVAHCAGSEAIALATGRIAALEHPLARLFSREMARPSAGQGFPNRMVTTCQGAQIVSLGGLTPSDAPRPCARPRPSRSRRARDRTTYLEAAPTSQLPQSSPMCSCAESDLGAHSSQ